MMNFLKFRLDFWEYLGIWYGVQRRDLPRRLAARKQLSQADMGTLPVGDFLEQKHQCKTS